MRRKEGGKEWDTLSNLRDIPALDALEPFYNAEKPTTSLPSVNMTYPERNAASMRFVK